MKLSESGIKKILDDHAAWLQGEETGKRADFSKDNWSGVDLHGANLQNAFLSVTYFEAFDDYDYFDTGDPPPPHYGAARTDLSGANLSGANLQGANLSGANLSGADLSNANLRGADMSRSCCEEADESLMRYGVPIDYKSYKTDLSGADLSNADLSGANLSEANLTGADLTNANLRGANLRLADLTDAILKNADLSGADLKKTNFTNADLTDAKLRGVKGYNVSSGDA